MASDKNLGQFTCVNFQGCSVVDYVLASKPMYMFDIFKVHDLSVYSDYCMLSLTSTLAQDFEHFTTEHQSSSRSKFIWQNDKKVELWKIWLLVKQLKN